MGIELVCDSVRLFRFIDGKDLYINQVSEKFDYSSCTTIVFPYYVSDISISFIDGFLSEVYKYIDKFELAKYIKIEGPTYIVDKFYTYYSYTCAFLTYI